MMTTSTALPALHLRVEEARLLNPLIRLLRLRSADGAALPAYSAGAHIKVHVSLPDGQQDGRQYSLINLGLAKDANQAPTDYLIAVRLERDGRGGSRWMHEKLQVGDTVAVEAPRNDFALHAAQGTTVLVAGGIGVTPLISMAAQCKAEGRAVRMHYAGRRRDLMAFLPELQALLQENLVLHVDEEAGSPLDIAGLLDRCTSSDRLHVCGPKVMLDAVLAQAHSRGWAPERVRFELFAAPEVQAGDQAFEIVVSSSGRSLTVAPHQSILDVLIEAGLDPVFDCKRGECGVCAVGVISGDIDHRDYVLTQREKEAANVIQTCVSRCRGPRLVLDL